MIYTLLAGLITFLVTSLVTGLPNWRPRVLTRLAIASLTWLGLILAQVFESNPESFLLTYWLIPYSAGLGAFLGVGVQWWKPSNWRRPRFGSFEFSFASRITFRSERSISGLVVRLGMLSICLGVAVMEVATSIVYGFQGAIQEKVIGFGAHIRVGNLLEELESEIDPLPRYNDFIPEIAQMEEVTAVYPYIVKPVMLRSASAQEGIVLKGVDSTFSWDFFGQHLKAGALPDVTRGKRFSKDLLVSKKLADLLDLEVGEKAFAFFYDEEKGRPRSRQFLVSGIYETGLGEFDAQYAICDLRVPQEFWRWEADEVEGFEVKIRPGTRLDELESIAAGMLDLMPYQYEATPITRDFPELFEWVELQHQNVWLILGLMVGIAIINMISVILILILERTQTVGLLKALGMSNARVQGLFVTNAFFLILIGLALGNLLGLSLIWTQDLWGWFRVDQDSYFVDVVPVMWVWEWFLGINVGVLLVCTVFMYIPAWLVTRISPVSALRFE